MLTSYDFEMCIKGLLNLEQTDEVKRIKRKLELVISAEDIKKDSEEKMFEINQELRKFLKKKRK